MGGSSNKQSEKLGVSATVTEFSCLTLIFKAQLASPKEEVISQLSNGDILEITISPEGKCIAIYEGKVAGAISCIYLKQLLDCMEDGNRYHAEVRSINGAKCTITVKISE